MNKTLSNCSSYKPKKVLVIMAYFNGKKYILSQLKSILNQKSVKLYIIIGDDKSNINDLLYLKKITSHIKNIKIIKRAKKFGTPGKNFIDLIKNVKLKNFDYIALSDQDDIWCKNKLITAIKKLKASRASSYSSAVTAFWPDGKKKNINLCPNLKEFDFLFEGAGQGNTFVMTRFLFLKLQKFCQQNIKYIDNFEFHDWLIYIFTRTSNEKWYFDSKSQIYYRQHGSNFLGVRYDIKSILYRWQLIRSGWYLKQLKKAVIISKLNLNNNSIKNNEKIKLIEDYLIHHRSILLQFKFIFFALSKSRRKFLDRLIIVASIIFCYI